MTFKEFVEDWCIRHPLLLHEPEGENKRFFLVRDIAAIPDFTRSLPENESPCIMFDLMTDEQYFSDGKREVSYTLYFAAQAGNGTNLPDEMEEVEHAFKVIDVLIQNFRKYCVKVSAERKKGIPIIDTYFRTFPYGPLLNGWYAKGVQLQVVENVTCEDYELLKPTD